MGIQPPFLPLTLGFFSSCDVEHPQRHLFLRSHSLAHQLHVREGPPGDGTSSAHSKRCLAWLCSFLARRGHSGAFSADSRGISLPLDPLVPIEVPGHRTFVGSCELEMSSLPSGITSEKGQGCSQDSYPAPKCPSPWSCGISHLQSKNSW